MKGRSTIRDVAARAGVSTATVSFVLNNNPKEVISEKVRKRVLEVARALNYQASAAASGLKRKSTRNVGVIFYRHDDAIANPFYSFVVQGAVKEGLERNYNLLFSFIESNYTGFDDLPKVIREKNVEGVLFMRHTYPKMIRDIQSLEIPIVAVDNFPRIKNVDSMQIDNRKGGQLAAEYLLELGHTRLAYLGPEHPPPSVEERFAGFRQGLEKHDRKWSARNFIVCKALTFEAAHEAARAALAKNKRLSAVFCANDEMAAGVLRAARECGRALPDDLSVIGFDDITMANYTDPPLTTIGVVKEHLGRRAMSRLIDLVEGADHKVKTELAPVTLVVRGSTAKAFRAAPPGPGAFPR
jgi:DNA-binding LacI/PurR family transcriptional regulator